MKHRLKEFTFKFLELLPDKLGNLLYHKVQKFFDKMSSENRLKSAESTYLDTSKICQQLNIAIEEKTILDFGSGWLPMMPYFFLYQLKAKKVLTYDINRHFQKTSILKLNAAFSKLYGYTVIVDSKNKYGLPAGIDYVPLCDLTKAAIPKVDVIFSRYVLSHMTKNDVIELHRKIKNELPANTYLIHYISPSDLRQYVNKDISMQDFLQYSEEEWNKIQTKFSSHNRMRLPQFLEIFKSLDFEVVYLTYKSAEVGSKQYEMFKEIKLHSDFAKYTDEELTAGNIVIVLKT